MEKLISVIIPVYNVVNYFDRCINSIINQTFKNLEIIIVDDGSTDGSSEACDKIAKIDNRIKVIHQINIGLSAARNAGLNIATGEYIAFVDSDDYLHPRMYEILYKEITKNEVDMVICEFNEFEEEPKYIANIDKYDTRLYNKNELLNEIYSNKSMVFAWNKLYKKKIFSTLRYPEGYLYEDAFIIADIFEICNSAIFVYKELYFYSRERKDSITLGKFNFKKLYDELAAHKKNLEYFKEKESCELKMGYNWAFYIYINRIKKYYDEVKINSPQRHDVLYKLIFEYCKTYSSKTRKMIMNKKMRRKYDFYYFNFKLQKLKYIRRDIKRIVKIYSRNKLIRNVNTIKTKKIFLIGTPEYGNLGDQAIAIASKKFLDDNFKKEKIIEITSADYCYGGESIKRIIKPDDTIIITGGGFMGSLWLSLCEEVVRDVLSSFPKNKIVILPQTVFFEDSDYGKRQFEISKKIYESHSNLTICLREKKSYEFIRENMPKIKIELIPDMVFYLKENEKIKRKKTKKALICFRKDKEKIQTNYNDILNKIYQNYSKINKIDTAVEKSFSLRTRYKAVKSILNKIKKSDIIVTDRLHGMLFAYITNTKCIAFDNLSGKIKSTYDTWLKDSEYICMNNEFEKAKKRKNKIEYAKYWEKLVEIIKS